VRGFTGVLAGGVVPWRSGSLSSCSRLNSYSDYQAQRAAPYLTPHLFRARISEQMEYRGARFHRRAGRRRSALAQRFVEQLAGADEGDMVVTESITGSPLVQSLKQLF
jgi:hypothetical protein